MKNKYSLLNVTLCLALQSILIICNGQSSSQGNNNGNTVTIVPIAGSTSSWLNVSNVKAFDGAYAVNSVNMPVTGNYSDYIVVTGFGFSIPVGNIIDGIKVSVSRWETNSEVKDYKIRLVKNNVIETVDRLSGVAWPTVNTTRAYGSSSDLWGSTWALSEINSSGFGFAIAVQKTAGATPVSARIDNVRITVYYSADPNPLPVELVNFTAIPDANNIEVAWQTASETNNNYFTLEKSTDGLNFTSSHVVKGAGNSIAVTKYSYTDMNTVASPVIYYRLNQTDFDGTTKNLGTKAVNMNYESDVVSIYPNPFTGPLHVCVENMAASVSVMVSDISGKKLLSENFERPSFGNELVIDALNKLNPGIYYITITNNGAETVKKIIKKS
jgi:hypothetical protein